MKNLSEFIEANNLIEDETIIRFLANNVMATAYYQGSDNCLLYFGLSPYSNGAATSIDKINTFEIMGDDTCPISVGIHRWESMAYSWLFKR